MVQHCLGTDFQVAQHYLEIDFQVAQDCLEIDFQVAQDCLETDYRVAQNYLLSYYQLAQYCPDRCFQVVKRLLVTYFREVGLRHHREIDLQDRQSYHQ